MGVTNWEMHGWPRGKWDRGEFDGERRIMCAWADRLDMLAQLDADPEWPTSYYIDGPQWAYIRSAQTLPFGKSTAAANSEYASYEWCLIVCHYSTRGPQWDALNNQWMEETIDPAFNSFSVDSKNLRWGDDSQVLPGDAPVNHDVLVEYQRMYHYLPDIPSWVLTMPGGCNANTVTTFLIPGISFAPETLKYLGTSIRTSYTLGKIQRFDLTAKFTYKWSGWNKFWRADSGGGSWETIYDKDGTKYVQHPLIAI